VSKYVLIAVLGLSLAACSAPQQYTEAKTQYAATGKVSNGWPYKLASGEPVKGPLCKSAEFGGYVWPNAEVCK
jgi:hypothetical protein